MRRIYLLSVVLPVSFACASANPPPAAVAPTAASADYSTLVAAPDRSPEDKALDAGRQPGKLLEFIGVNQGMNVGEICSAGGYTTELLARAVGPNGKVYGENPKVILEKFAEQAWSARLSKPVMANVVRTDRELDSPFPAEVKNLDSVVNVLFYHDTVWLNADRTKMNSAIFSALKPGGTYIIVDHSARAGSGVADASTLHRIDEAKVRAEVESAGFKFSESTDFLRNPDDARDWNASPKSAGDKRGKSDRFALKFVKPQA